MNSQENYIGVVGSGTMGNGIAHVFAQSNYKVILVDLNQSILDNAMKTISSNLKRQVKKELITQSQMNHSFDNITTSTNMKSLRNAFIVIEAASEDEINYSDWRLINADYVLLTSVIENNSGVEARYEIFDIRKKSKIRSSKVYGVSNNIRQLSHYISDGIYEAITGMKGVASAKIIYVSQSNSIDSPYKLYVADADGANEQLLVKSPEPIISPAWSPDSKKVAYVSFETGIANVYIQDISTGERNPIFMKKCSTCFNEQISSPAWSPDGNYLSLTLNQDGNAEIYIYNIKKKSFIRLTNHYSVDTESNWSPDGKKLMFTSGRSGSPQLYEIDLRKPMLFRKI